MTNAWPRVDHVSIAVRDIDRALDFFLETLPAAAGTPKQDGYGDPAEFRWADFTVGRFRIELIESARPGSFVERFIARRGEGLHHFSFKVAELDPLIERLERDGRRIVDRFRERDGSQTAFIHPRSSFGTLIQFWQTADAVDDAPSWGGVVCRDGIRWQVDHLSLALRAIDPAVRFFERHFGGRLEFEPELGYDRSFRLVQMRLGDYRLELMEPASAGSFLDRFLRRRGEGMHHISIDVEDLDRALAPFEQRGVAIVDRFQFASDWKTAFLHPRSAFGTLIQFWQMPLCEWSKAPEEGAWRARAKRRPAPAASPSSRASEAQPILPPNQR